MNWCLYLRAVHFDIAYNADRIIEINVSTDPSQTVDISEDVVKVPPAAAQYEGHCRAALQTVPIIIRAMPVTN